MAQIMVSINERSYRIACADGQEARLYQLASLIDDRARRLAKELPMVDEARLLLMTNLMIADELVQATHNPTVNPPDDYIAPAAEEQLVISLGESAERLSGLVEWVKRH